MSYTLRELLYGALYMSSCRTANIDRFVDIIAQHYNIDEESDPGDFQSHIRQAASTIDFPDVVTNDAEAQRRLIADDLRSFIPLDIGMAIGNSSSVEDGVINCQKPIQDRLGSVGLNAYASPLYVVDSFAPPFDKFDWSAFAPDSEDEQNFNIPQGVHFKRSRLRPLYSQALYAHEVIHTITGRVDPEVFVAGLEEGMAEVIGTCFGGLATLQPATLKNILVYGRHGIDRPHIWSLYRDHTRQAFLLYLEFGLAGIVELVSQGRAAIHRAASAIATGSYRRLPLPRGAVHEPTREILEFSCLGFVPAHAYRPLDCLLAIHVSSGAKIDDICRRAAVDPRSGRDRIRSVSSESALFIVNGEFIGYSNVETLIQTEEVSQIRQLRYAPVSTG